MAVEWQELDAAAFDALPARTKPPKGDADWEAILGALEAGKVVKLPYQDEKELRGKRLSLGRRAIRRGFRVELRYGDGFIAARKSGHVVTDGPPAAEEVDPALAEPGEATEEKPARRRRKPSA